MPETRIGVIGAGTMGRGIAQLFALYDYRVVLVDRVEGLIEDALEKVRARTDEEEWPRVKALIETSADINALKDSDVVVEAVFEQMSVKREVFASLKGVTRPDAVIASNTSALSIDAMAGAAPDPTRFIGMHFMNPPKVMKLVEVVRGPRTSGETVKLVTALARSLDKVPAVVNDSPGFVSNRLLFAVIGEAMWLLERGVAEKKDIDNVMKFGMNHPMGPIELADLIGLDICHNIMLTLYESLDDKRFKPPPVLEGLLHDGKLGRKTGEGFYKYEE